MHLRRDIIDLSLVNVDKGYTVLRSEATPLRIEAALEVSSSTGFVGSYSILMFSMDELEVPDKLDPLDIDRSDLTLT